MKRLSTYLRLQSKDLQDILVCGESAFNATQFHALRVTIKKLKAIRHLSQQAKVKHKHPVSFKPIQRLFRKAGMLRDTQLTRECLQHHLLAPSLPNAIASLELQSKEQKAIFIDMIRRQGKKPRKTIRCLRKEVKGIKRKKIRQWIREQTRAAGETLATTNSNPAQWHQLRKILKSLGYIHQASHLPLQKTALTRQLDSIAQVLGDWHDSIVVSKQIELLVSSQLMPDAENTALATIHAELVIKGKHILDVLAASFKQSSIVKV